ncbi:MAG: conjugal transfer protein TraB [Euryarchaeota archaeon]|nr:conjugal transfer protein TraB [Euryarchaeota archaeon]|tara:strand:+ start:1126 stop:2289 length:1164 start_codon:yes stop_codon:yes gene_type:complete
MSDTVIDLDNNVRIVGTAHVSKTSIDLVQEQISEFEPDIVAVELCESRLKSLQNPSAMDNEDLLSIIKDGRSGMILLQSALASQQRKMGIEQGEKPGAELLRAIDVANEMGLPIELIDRDIVTTLRRAWKKMGFMEKVRVLNAILWSDNGEDGEDIEALLEDSDMLSKVLEEARDVAPKAGVVLIDERDRYMASRIRQVSEQGKVLAVVGAGHLSGIKTVWEEPPDEGDQKVISKLDVIPTPSIWPKILVGAIPAILVGIIGWMWLRGDFTGIGNTLGYWMIANAALAGLGVALAGGHPLSVVVGAIASPFTSLNPALAAGWFAGYTQYKMQKPTGLDASEFLVIEDMSGLWKNRVGRILLVTALGNLGSSLGAWLAGAAIIGAILG